MSESEAELTRLAYRVCNIKHERDDGDDSSTWYKMDASMGY